MHYALHRLKIKPGEFVQMPKWEQAFILASVELHLKSEKKAADRAKKTKAHRR